MRFRIETSLTGAKTLAVEDGENRRYLYSRNDPLKDGLRFFEKHREEFAGLCIFLGLGIGHHIKPFLKEKGLKKCIVLEPLEELYRKVRNMPEVREVLEHSSVEVYIGERALAYASAIREHYEYLFYERFAVFVYPPFRNAFFSQYNRLEKLLKKGLEALLDDGLTIARFSRLWLNNFVANMRSAGSFEPVSSLYGTRTGTALITGAGPSLDSAIRVLKNIDVRKKNFFLMATDASVKPLLKNGIRPDLIVSLDPQHAVYSHFSGLDPESLSTVPAVLSALTCARVFNLFKTRYIYFTRHPLTRFFFDAETLMKQGVVLNYRSVSAFALRIALNMGFGAVCLAGFDYSFPRLRIYAKGAFFYDHAFSVCTRTNPPSAVEARLLWKTAVPAGSKCSPFLYTSARLLEYLGEIEELVGEEQERTAAKIIKWGSDGMAIRGVPQEEKPRLELDEGTGAGVFDAGKKNEKKAGGVLQAKGFINEQQGERRLLIKAGEGLGGAYEGIVLTLALRNRLVKGMSEKESYTRARDFTAGRLSAKFAHSAPVSTAVSS